MTSVRYLVATTDLRNTYRASAGFDAECEQLQRAVIEGRTKITRLEEEVFELKCARRQQRDAEVRAVVLSNRGVPAVGGNITPRWDARLVSSSS